MRAQQCRSWTNERSPLCLSLGLLAVHVEAARFQEGGVGEAAVDGGLGSLLWSLTEVAQKGLNDSTEDTLVVSRDLSPVNDQCSSLAGI